MSDNAREVIAETARRNLDKLGPGQDYALADDMLANFARNGFVVVPEQPTIEMLTAAVDRDSSAEVSLYQGIWWAMLSAAPAGNESRTTPAAQLQVSKP